MRGGGAAVPSPRRCLRSAPGCPRGSVVPMHRPSCWGLPYLVRLVFVFFSLLSLQFLNYIIYWETVRSK